MPHLIWKRISPHTDPVYDVKVYDLLDYNFVFVLSQVPVVSTIMKDPSEGSFNGLPKTGMLRHHLAQPPD